MSGKGFIKLHRQLTDWEWFHNSEMVHLWLYLLLKANHADNRWQGMEIKRGQLVTGRKQISKDTGLSERTIRTCINRLKSTSQLSVKTTNKFSIITILNYDKYQGRNFENDQQNDQQAVTPATSNRPQTRMIKNDKKKEEVKKSTKRKPSPAFDAHQLRPDWFPEQAFSDLVEHRKKKKTAQTGRAYRAIVNEIEKATLHGFTVDECVDTICEADWKGFRLEWMKNRRDCNNRPRSKKDEHDETRERWARELLESEYGINRSQKNSLVEGLYLDDRPQRIDDMNE